MTNQAHFAAAPVVLGETRNGEAGAQAGFNFHMLSPILVGLTLPMLVIGLLDPSGLRPGRPMVMAFLVTVFVLSAVLFAASLIWQGEIKSIIFHSESRKVEFVQVGLLANTSSHVHFDQVVAIGTASRFDADGYPFSQAEIQLRDGQRIALPPGTLPADLAAARVMIGR